MPKKTNPTFEQVFPDKAVGLENQRAHVYRVLARLAPCPACRQGVSKYMARPEPARAVPDAEHVCPFCGAALTFRQAATGDWYWDV